MEINFGSVGRFGGLAPPPPPHTKKLAALFVGTFGFFFWYIWIFVGTVNQ